MENSEKIRSKSERVFLFYRSCTNADYIPGLEQLQNS